MGDDWHPPKEIEKNTNHLFDSWSVTGIFFNYFEQVFII